MNEIGKIMKFNDTKLLVVEGNDESCDGCFFQNDIDKCNRDYKYADLLPCLARFRTDKTPVIYKQINFLFGK